MKFDMPEKILTIIVPTYNRARNLGCLLDQLKRELSGFEELVEVIIGNNASTDDSPELIRKFESEYSSVCVINHHENLGPDENFYRCIDRVKTKFFWIIGDDDAPYTGVIKELVCYLQDSSPDLVYLCSKWVKDIQTSSIPELSMPLKPTVLNAVDFSALVNVWLTFISGMIINRDSLLKETSISDIRRCLGTHLVQLGWILPLLKRRDGKFVFIRNECVIATADNTGGYGRVRVFAKNLTEILNSIFDRNDRLARVITRRNIFAHLPGLIWASRFNNRGAFIDEDCRDELSSVFIGKLSFRLFLMPLVNAPKPIAYLFLRVGTVYKRVMRIHDAIVIRFA